MKKIVSVALLLFVAVSFAQNDSNEKVVTPKIISKLKLNNTYKANEIEVKLVEVVSDSRCPTGVDCMWGGEAVVLVDIFKNGKKLEQKKVTFDTDEEKAIYSSEKISIMGLKILPYPNNDVKINPEDYYIQLESKEL